MRLKMLALKSSVAAVAGAACFACLLLSPSGPAYALDDGAENLFDTVLNMLAVNPWKTDDKAAAADIDYRERAPLVLPPKMDLQQPQEAGAHRSAAWPQDPDVVQRKKAAAESHWKGSPAKGNDVLSKQELMAGRTTAVEQTQPTKRCGDREHWCLYVNPDDLRNQNIDLPDHPAAVAVGEEPEREYLTQPPKGYRVATRKVQPTFEAPKKDDSADPKAYWRKKPADDE
jgi:hypothetical protein